LKAEETELQKNETSEVQKNKKFYKPSVIFTIALLVALFIYIYKVDGVDNVRRILNEANYTWVIAGLICLVIMWICEAITLYLPIKKIYPSQTFGNAFKITMIGQLFNNLTPFASGGQLMQAYIMSKEGKRTSDALSVLTMKFVLTQSTLIIFTVIVVLTQFHFFTQLFKNLVWIGIIGIVINVAVVVLFYLAGAHKEFVMKIAKPLIRLGGKIHIGKWKMVKDPDKKIEEFTKSVEHFSMQFMQMKNNKKMVAAMLTIGLIQNILYYAITYTIYKAFGNSGATFLQIITTQAFLMLIMTIFPTPGAGIGAEGGFYLLFENIFKNGTINLSILFWRIYVFYLPIIVGALFFLPTKRKEKASK
jgi:uncharacterized protein (TIRG00374 family)